MAHGGQTGSDLREGKLAGAFDSGGTDGDGGTPNRARKQLLGDQTAVTVTDDHWWLWTLGDDCGEVLGGFLHSDPRNGLGMRAGGGHRVGFVRPTRRDWRVALG